ncbi:MAG: PucR family transcriptional regulator, partial [Mycobacterium sp.]
MTESRHDHATTVAHFAAAVVDRLGERLAEVTSSIQQLLVSEIAEMRDAELLQVLRDSVGANVDTLFSAIRHAIPIEHVEPPTAALEHARRLAQRGMSVNALVRAYRLGHKAVLNIALDEVGALNLEPQLSLEVFGQIAEVTFGYIDWMSQQVVATYESERDRWVENRNSLRAWQVRELLDGADTDVDSMTTAIRYPLRRIHLSLVLWCGESDGGDQLVPMERFIDQLAESLGAREGSLFIPVDRLTAWAWIPLPAEATSNAVAQLR